MSPNDDTPGFQVGWAHIMGTLDAALDDARGNLAMLRQPDEAINGLLKHAEQQRAEAQAVFQELMTRREALAQTLDEVQRALAVAGLPLRGEIS